VNLPLNQRDFSRTAFETPSVLDAIDRRIAAELRTAPRLRIAELGRRVGLSSPAVADRLRRLEDTGVLSYRAEVDPRALGYTICAIVRISPRGGGLRLIPGIAADVPNVTECYRITGEDCFLVKLYLRSIDELEPILDLFTPHGRTTTSIVQSSPVPPRSLPLTPELAVPKSRQGYRHSHGHVGRGVTTGPFGMTGKPRAGRPVSYGTAGRAGVVSWEGILLLVGSG